MLVGMVQVSRSRHHYTYAEYLAYERDSGFKHDFDDGEIRAMAGGSRRHNALALRMGAVLDSTRGSGCVAFQSDQKVRILATGRATYPDATAVCGPIEGDPDDPSGQTITNPTLLVEVLSQSTEEDDRGAKWLHYQRIPSLKEYVLVSQDTRRIERYQRQPNGSWDYVEVSGNGQFRLITGAVIDLEALYAELPD